MSRKADAIASFVASHDKLMLVEVRRARGSAPREAGAFMLVSETEQYGTIGGGQLEFQMIAEARRYLSSGTEHAELAIALGPGIGQCCGGNVDIGFALWGGADSDDLLARIAAEQAALSPVYVFGAGHVGLALAAALKPLPIRVILVDTRAEQLAAAEAEIETRLTPVPEAEVRKAPPGAAFIAVTHDHALDFLITGAALGRADAFYVGMIGSRTKRAQFRRWYFDNGGDARKLAALVCPIGDSGVEDKRPEVIAALTVAEIIVKMHKEPSNWATKTQALETAKGDG